MDEFKTPDQIEQEILEWFSFQPDLNLNQTEIANEAIAMFRRGLSKNGYVFYQP